MHPRLDTAFSAASREDRLRLVFMRYAIRTPCSARQRLLTASSSVLRADRFLRAMKCSLSFGNSFRNCAIQTASAFVFSTASSPCFRQFHPQFIVLGGVLDKIRATSRPSWGNLQASAIPPPVYAAPEICASPIQDLIGDLSPPGGSSARHLPLATIGEGTGAA